MNGLLDTHIILDFLKGQEEAFKEVERYSEPLLSVITVIDLMLAVTEEKKDELKQFFEYFKVVSLNEDVGRRAVELAKRYPQLKMPQACIWASAQTNGCLFVTRNKKAYPVLEVNDIRVPY